jgi:hypothetical protein
MGKASLLFVVGYGLLFLISGVGTSDLSVQAYDNALDYYESSQLHNIAIGGANMTANYLFRYPPGLNGNPWWGGYTTAVTFAGGSFVSHVDSTTSVDPFSGEARLTVRTTATYADSSYTIIAVLGQSKFSKFAVWAGPPASGGAYWETGDSVFGPVHSEGLLKTIGYPYFGGKVTTRSGVYNLSGYPILTAGLETGVSVPANRSFQKLAYAAASNGKNFTGSGNLWLKFQGDSLKYRRVAGHPDTAVYLPSFAPNGAITLAQNTGNIFVEGTIKGRYTIGSLDSSSGSRGRIIVTGDIRYHTNPEITPSSTDMLGLVAYNEIILADNGAPSFTIHGSMFSYTKGVAVQNYSTRPQGIFTTLGGWVVDEIYATSNGIPLGDPSSRGYKCHIGYDERFRFSSPPFFPGTNAYEILAWYE